MVLYRHATVAGATSGTSYSCAKPTGTVEGDVVLAFQTAGTLAEMTTPNGGVTWQLLDSETSNTVLPFAGKVWWKSAGAAEPGTYQFLKASGQRSDVIVIASIGGATTAPKVASLNTPATSDGFNANTPGLTPEGDEDLEIRFAAGVEAA